MKELLDKGFLKNNPKLIKNTMIHVIQRRQDKVFSLDNGAKPNRISPKRITVTTFQRRLIKVSNAI